jgi:hypothetical protein
MLDRGPCPVVFPDSLVSCLFEIAWRLRIRPAKAPLTLL